MNSLVCEMCGSVDLMKQDGVFVCQACGCKYSVEEAKRMMIEGSVDVSGSTVKVDTSAELKNLYELARRAKADNNSENARKYYEQIIIKDPSSWEANFYATYYQSMQCKIGEIASASVRISNCEDTVFNLIKENVTDLDEQRKAVDEVASALISISRTLFNAYQKFHDNHGSLRESLATTARRLREYNNNCGAAKNIVYYGGDWIVEIFGDAYGEIASRCWELAVIQHNKMMPRVHSGTEKENADTIKKYIDKIKKYNPTYQAPKINENGCYVATAVYGSYDCPQVWTLRRYRDYTLAETWYGRAFIRTYYAISPTLVKWFGHTGWFKKMWKGKLDRMVKNLQEQGFESTPYEDKKW